MLCIIGFSYKFKHSFHFSLQNASNVPRPQTPLACWVRLSSPPIALWLVITASLKSLVSEPNSILLCFVLKRDQIHFQMDTQFVAVPLNGMMSVWLLAWPLIIASTAWTFSVVPDATVESSPAPVLVATPARPLETPLLALWPKPELPSCVPPLLPTIVALFCVAERLLSADAWPAIAFARIPSTAMSAMATVATAWMWTPWTCPMPLDPLWWTPSPRLWCWSPLLWLGFSSRDCSKREMNKCSGR